MVDILIDVYLAT